MSGFDLWLEQATRHLSNDSAVQVRTEIREHYEYAREAAISSGASVDEAERQALNALGDAREANRDYLEVMLTAAEARLLKDGDWESRVICSHRIVKSLLLSVPGIALVAAALLSLAGAKELARVLVIGSVGMSLLFLAPFLPVYTPLRSRIARCVRWIVLVGILVTAFGPDAFKYSWLLISSLWPMAWIEWRRTSIRRKLPVQQWPKHLYL